MNAIRRMFNKDAAVQPQAPPPATAIQTATKKPIETVPLPTSCGTVASIRIDFDASKYVIC